MLGDIQGLAIKPYFQHAIHDWIELYEKLGKLETTEESKAIDPKRIGDDHIEVSTLFASVTLELRVTVCEFAVAAATPALPELIDPFPLEPDIERIV